MMLTDSTWPLALPLGLSLPTLLGVAGFMIYAGADIALCLRRISSEGITFYLLNIAAAAMIGVSLLYSFNLGAFLTEVFCLGTSVLAVMLRLRDRRRVAAHPDTLRPPSTLGAPCPTPAPDAPRPPRNRTLQGARPMPGPVHGRPGCGLFPDRMA